MIAYRLQPNDNLPEDIQEQLYDIDEDFTTKQAYKNRAKRLTEFVNEKFKVNYKWDELFPKPTDIGWRYCKNCGEFYWKDDVCGC